MLFWVHLLVHRLILLLPPPPCYERRLQPVRRAFKRRHRNAVVSSSLFSLEDLVTEGRHVVLGSSSRSSSDSPTSAAPLLRAPPSTSPPSFQASPPQRRCEFIALQS